MFLNQRGFLSNGFRARWLVRASLSRRSGAGCFCTVRSTRFSSTSSDRCFIGGCPSGCLLPPATGASGSRGSLGVTLSVGCRMLATHGDLSPGLITHPQLPAPNVLWLWGRWLGASASGHRWPELWTGSPPQSHHRYVDTEIGSPQPPARPSGAGQLPGVPRSAWLLRPSFFPERLPGRGRLIGLRADRAGCCSCGRRPRLLSFAWAAFPSRRPTCLSTTVLFHAWRP